MIKKNPKNLNIVPLMIHFVLIGVIFSIAYRHIFSSGMLAFGDLPPFPQKPFTFIDYFVSAWHPHDLGNANPAYMGYPFLAVFVYIFRDPVLAQKVLFLGLLPFSSASMYYLMAWLVQSKVARSSASIIYATNYVALFLFNSGSLGLLVIYALLPTLLCCWFRFLQDKITGSGRHLLMFTLLFSIGISFNIQIVLLLMPFLIVSLIVDVSIHRDSRHFLIKSGLLLASTGVSFATVLPGGYFAPASYAQYFSPSVIESMVNSATFWYSYYFPTLISPFIIISEGSIIAFVFPLVAFSFLLLKRHRQRALNIAISFLIVALSLGLFCFLISIDAMRSLFFAFPALLALREPIKLMAPIALAMSVLFGLSIDSFETQRISLGHRTNRLTRHIPKVLAVLGIISVLLSQNALIFSGDMGLQGLTSYIGGPHTWNYTIPQVYYDVSEWLNTRREEEGFFRTLWLPLDYETMERLRWIDPYHVTLSPSSTGFEFVEFTMQSIANGSSRIGALLGLMNIKYIVVNTDAGSRGPIRIIRIHGIPRYLTGEPYQFVELLDAQEDLTCVKREESFIVYKNNNFLPHIFSSKRLFSVFLSEGSGAQSKNITDNLVQNPSFEEGLESWRIGESCYLSHESVSGNHSIEILNNSTVHHWERAYQVLPVVGGAQYRISFWMRISNARKSHLKLIWYDDAFGRGERCREDQPQIGVDGTIGWWRVSDTYIAPAKAKSVSLMICGGWSLDGVQPGRTWVDEVDFRRIYESCGRVLSPFSALQMLSYLPEFKLDTQVFSFSDGVADSGLWNISDTVILLGGSKIPDYISNYKPLPNIVSMFEAEQNVSPDYNTTLLITSEASGTKAIRSYGPANLRFTAYKSAAHQVLVRGTLQEETYLSIGNRSIPLQPINTDIQGSRFQWFVSDVFQLPTGEVSMSFKADKYPLTLDLVLVISFSETGMDWTDILLPSGMEFNGASNRVNSTSAIFQINLTAPQFIFLGENYHPEWTVFVDRMEIHSVSNNAFGNVFYIPTGMSASAEIRYSGQAKRNILIMVSVAVWISLVATVIYAWRGILLARGSFIKKIGSVLQRAISWLRKRFGDVYVHSKT